MALSSADGQQAGQHGGGSVALAQVPLGMWPYSALGGYLGTVLLQQQSQAYLEGAVLRPQAARQVASLLAGGQGDSPGRGVGAALPDGGEQQDGGALRTKARHAAKHQLAEKRRRNRISTALQQLRDVLPPDHGQAANTGDFLARLLGYVTQLQALAGVKPGQVLPSDTAD